MAKTYHKPTQFHSLATKIHATVQRYWQAHSLPLGWRYAVSPFMNQLKAEHREEFKVFLVLNQYVHEQVAAKTGSRYLFPQKVANALSEDGIRDAMYRLQHVQRFEHNRSRNERSAASIDNNLIPRDAIPIKRRKPRGSSAPPDSKAS